MFQQRSNTNILYQYAETYPLSHLPYLIRKYAYIYINKSAFKESYRLYDSLFSVLFISNGQLYFYINKYHVL